MSYLLDTNVVSELRKVSEGKANSRVAAWSAGTRHAELFISVVTVRELEFGVLMSERRDPPAGRVLRAWSDRRVLREFLDRILPIDVPIARRCAALHVPNPRPERDALIAATALVHGMSVVTRNVADFAGTGVQIINPWEA